MYYQVYSFSLFVCYILVGVGATESALESAPIQDFAKGLPPFQPEEKMLICLDYDGTLKPQQPGELTAEERRESFQTLQTLANNPNYHVYIISARPFKNLKDEFGEIEGLKLGGSHGVELGSTASAEPVVISQHPQIERLRRYVKQVFNQEGMQWAPDSPISVSFNFQETRLSHENIQIALKEVEKFIENMRPNFEIHAAKGSFWVEIRVANVNKAIGIQHIIQEAFIADAPFLGGISIGDSGTDEPMHYIMNTYNFRSVVVGNTVQNSHAKIRFPSYRVTNEYLKDWANRVAKWQAEKDEK